MKHSTPPLFCSPPFSSHSPHQFPQIISNEFFLSMICPYWLDEIGQPGYGDVWVRVTPVESTGGESIFTKGSDLTRKV